MPNTKNYMDQGGERWVIGGTIELSDGTSMLIGESTLAELLAGKLSASPATTQADSSAADVAALVVDFNALLSKLKTAGIMAAE